MSHVGSKKAILGISGGLDSTLALLVTTEAMNLQGLPMKNIISVTMPGFGTTKNTKNNAVELAKCIGTQLEEINIEAACVRHMKDIGHDIKVHDITYENVQARERTQILMDLANKEGALLVGTGDLSELALGWCTYNGDHMSMYGVNSGVPKPLVRHLVDFVSGNSDSNTSKILKSILDTPISPELLPPGENGEIVQKTEEQLGPYEVHDFFLYHFMRYGSSPDKIIMMAERAFKGKYASEQLKSWLTVFMKRFFSQQFKRSCLPDGPKVGSVSLSPRGDWRMPSDAECDAWIIEWGLKTKG
jgi:NAD+ synthase (glutamine-hydrolysing)